MSFLDLVTIGGIVVLVQASMRMRLRAWKEINPKCTRYHDWMEERI